MYVLALDIDLHLPECRSLKTKRAVLRPVIDGARRRFGVAGAEVGENDKWQRARIGFAAVGGTESHVRDVIDEVERWVWTHPAVEVLSTERTWLDT